MKNWLFPVWFVTAFLVIYTISPFLDAAPWLISSGYLLSPFLVIWMAVRVLKDGTPSGRTFDEGYFYDEETAPQSVDLEVKKN